MFSGKLVSMRKKELRKLVRQLTSASSRKWTKINKHCLYASSITYSTASDLPESSFGKKLNLSSSFSSCQIYRSLQWVLKLLIRTKARQEDLNFCCVTHGVAYTHCLSKKKNESKYLTCLKILVKNIILSKLSFLLTRPPRLILINAGHSSDLNKINTAGLLRAEVFLN
jgi:hypothetical protein